MTRSRALLLAGLAGLVLAGCQFPADPEGSLDRARGGTLRVGVVHAPPWASTAGRAPRGVEPALVRRFARSIGADVEWFEGTEAELAAALGGYQLDLVIGGLTRDFPYTDDAALTRPYIDTEVEIGLPPGSELPDALGGVEVFVRRGSEAAALLREEEDDAVPVPFDSLAEVDGPALLESYEITALGYERSDHILRDREHAMAVPAGENALLVELERFLLERGTEAEDLLTREVTR